MSDILLMESYLIKSNRFSTSNDKEELSVVELTGKTAFKTNEVVKALNGKLDKGGDFNGTWNGMSPSQTNEFIQSQVDQNTYNINFGTIDGGAFTGETFDNTSDDLDGGVIL